MRVLIVEDEPQAVQWIESLLMELIPNAIVVGKLESVKQSIQWFGANPAPDLVLMDIQLADGLSFQIFERCAVTSAVIFTTAFNEYAIKAFKVNSIDYLLKPIDKGELDGALKKFISLSGPAKENPGRMLENINLAMQMLTRKHKERFVIRVGEHLRSVEVTDVLFFFSLEKATFAQAKDGRKHIIDFTMDQLEGVVDPNRFFRINRKYLVAVDAIRDMISYSNSRLRLVLATSEENIPSKPTICVQKSDRLSLKVIRFTPTRCPQLEQNP